MRQDPQFSFNEQLKIVMEVQTYRRMGDSEEWQPLCPQSTTHHLSDYVGDLGLVRSGVHHVVKAFAKFMEHTGFRAIEKQILEAYSVRPCAATILREEDPVP